MMNKKFSIHVGSLKSIFYILILVILNTGCEPSKNNRQKQPNIILIMLDDLGFECIGSYGGTSYKTPNIDKLAATGIQFNQAYAQPLCTPTRIELMTGKHNFRNWKAFGILDPNEKTFGHLMKDAGYSTSIVGKWQLQSYDPVDYPKSEYWRGTGMHVEDAGFDDYCLWHTGHTEDKGSRYSNPTILANGNFIPNTKDKYGPDIFSDHLNNFVNQQSDKPFFVYYPMALTHDPFSPTPDSEIWADSERRMDNETTYFKDMVEYADKILGKIIENLEKKGIREETLILFYSDNGTHQTIYSNMGDKVVQGGKGLTIQAGIKVPLIANWPNHIKEGTVTNEFVSAIDFLPTVLDAGGVSIPENFLTDGQSFLPVLKGEETHRRDWVYIGYNPKPGVGKDDFHPSEFVLNDQYKLYGDGRFYDIEKDVLEKDTIHVPNASEVIKKTKFKTIIDSLKKYPTYGYIERLDPALDDLISKHARIELVAEGFNWSEGPVWMPMGQKLLFSDVPENKMYQWNDLSGLSIYMNPSGYTGSDKNITKGSNGLTLDNEGNLILCQVGDRRISRLKSLKDSLTPEFEPIVTNFKGKKFNSPNDLVYDKNGNLYFTDPSFGLGKEKSVIGFNGVYFLSKTGRLTLLDNSVEAPNGIAVSHDNKTLYVADSYRKQPSIWVYDIIGDGQVKNKRMFFDATKLRDASIDKQSPDGMKLDKDGNIYLAGPGGVLIITAEGKHLGTIRLDKSTGNCEFTDDGRFLFITCDDYLLRVNLKPYAK